MTFTRYAIYFAPPADAEWARFGASWLGWDAETGETVAHPELAGLNVAQITATPHKYGLHGTIKPPFRLTEGQTVEALHQASADLATSMAPVWLDGLELARLGRFLALRPMGDTSELGELAAQAVRGLDGFRAPAPPSELDRRRATGLNPAQEANLLQWGYPYVMNEFRFHITLTGKLPKPELPGVQDALEQVLTPMLPKPFVISDLALVGERSDGRFQMIHRYALSR
ncbi:DUF1045 domain-containing protein [Tropicibacter sp. Alg240-R139]|uniref:DUF1045 domain-containing protein n=1 Tax=Tropicibacter sp. Alg240-R139 TaxID=2305991 RepID=UPI0013E04169|nr:DUF1045 domain-containing protein [Tropicibacter sp. Alg240-R139]